MMINVHDFRESIIAFADFLKHEIITGFIEKHVV